MTFLRALGGLALLPFLPKIKQEEPYKKLEKAGNIRILKEGIKYQTITIPSDEAQFLESCKFSVERIAFMPKDWPYKITPCQRLV